MYLILGLPRSRTSWFSNLLDYGNSVCLHEYFSQGGNYSSLEIPDSLRVGFSEINPYLNYPDMPTVVINRNPLDVAESLIDGFYRDESVTDQMIINICLKAHERLMKVATERDALVVNFEDIDLSMSDILNHIGVTMPLDRAERLSLYRVEPVNSDLNTILLHENFIKCVLPELS